METKPIQTFFEIKRLLLLKTNVMNMITFIFGKSGMIEETSKEGDGHLPLKS